MIKCSNCGFNIDNENVNFCPNCGEKLSLKNKVTFENKTVKAVLCNVCGDETTPDADFCESCGAKLSGNEKIIEKEIQVEKNVEVKSEKEETVKKKSNKEFQQKNSSGKKTKNVKAATINTKSKDDTKLKGSQIAQIIVGLASIGFIILYAAGVFDKTEEHVHNHSTEQTSTISLDNIQEINTLENEVNRDTTNLNRVLELAHLLNDSGFLQRAIPYYQMYLRSYPNSADVLVDFGVVYFNLRQYDIAKKYMREGLKVEPAHQIAHLNLGVVNYSMGYMDSAAVWWQKAKDINPNTQYGMRAKNLLEKNLNGGN